MSISASVVVVADLLARGVTRLLPGLVGGCPHFSNDSSTFTLASIAAALLGRLELDSAIIGPLDPGVSPFSVGYRRIDEVTRNGRPL